MVKQGNIQDTNNSGDEVSIMGKRMVLPIALIWVLCGCLHQGSQFTLQQNQKTKEISIEKPNQEIQSNLNSNKKTGNRAEDRTLESPSSTDTSVKKHKNKKSRYFESLGVVWDVPVSQKVIALTFDDDPNPKFAPEILHSLKQNHAKATFFVLGEQVESYPKLVQREIMEGHEVANHTYSHPKIWRLSANQIKKEIMRTQQVIVSATGKKTSYLFRPIGGYIDDKMVNVAKKQGYRVILWSWHQDSSKPGVSKIVNKVVNNARNSDVVLFHDHGGDRSQTVKALKQILPKLRKKGFGFVTVSELLEMKAK